MTELTTGWVSRTHRAIAAFDLVRPRTVGDAVAAHRRGAVYLAGGIDQIQWMQDGSAPETVIDISNLDRLDAVEADDDDLHLGAGVTHHVMETHPEIARLAPDLARAWATIGNIRVRMAGTVGGNVMARHPNYDGPVLFAAAGARYAFETTDGETVVADADGWSAPPGALMTRIVVPLGRQRRLAFDRSLKPAISVAVAIEQGPTGAPIGRAAVGCAFEEPYCAPFDAAQASIGRAGALARGFVDTMPEPMHNAFASAGYRRRMAEVLVRRLIERLVEDDG